MNLPQNPSSDFAQIYLSLTKIDVTPLLITKGSAKLALYGMSAIKDERLHRLFRSKKVNFFRDDAAPDSWFNLLVLHQESSSIDIYSRI